MAYMKHIWMDIGLTIADTAADIKYGLDLNSNSTENKYSTESLLLQSIPPPKLITSEETICLFSRLSVFPSLNLDICSKDFISGIIDHFNLPFLSVGKQDHDERKIFSFIH